MSHAAQPLRRVVARRIAGTVLATLAVLLAVITAVYLTLRERADERWLGDAAAHFERQTQRVEAEWQRQAELLRAQIEFLGLLDDPDDRAAAARLVAYLASHGGVGTFTHVTVTRGDGSTLVHYGTRTGLGLPPAGAEPGWAIAPAEAMLYRVQRIPLQLGPRGAGQLFLHAPLNNALLSAIAFPGTALSLHWKTHDDLAVSEFYGASATRAGAGRPGDDRVHGRFAWAGVPGGPQLDAQRVQAAALPLAELALAAAGTAGCGLLAWLTIGRWARRHVAHIDAVTRAADGFTAGRAEAEPLGADLAAATRDAELEVQRLGRGVTAMMRATELSSADEAAALRRLEDLNATLEQRVAERTRELEVARDEALAAARTRQQIMAGVSHELRTPLVGLMGSLDLIDAGRLPPEQRRLVEVARRSGGALRTVIDDVLDYSRLEAVGATLRRERMRPSDVVTEVIALHAAVALHKGLQLVGDADDDAEGAAVLGDAARLRQVLLNLVGNAVKFTDRGEVALRVAARPGSDGHALVLRFEVRDTGPGIDAESQARLFTPFAQTAGSPTAHRGGTGLGLAISQRLVVAMGGRIHIDSRPGAGACFWFEVELPPALPVADEAPVAGAQSLRGRVLLVEDNPVNRMIASEMLRRLGLQVEEAENGLLALEALRRQPADLVLMDLQMPVLDGLATAERIRRGDAGDAVRQVPIVAVTANALQEDVAACENAGMDGHLAKPFTPRELATCIAPWLPEASLAVR
ncbi:MAG: response regulator [Piscinibacter sp.]|nr:response regulator [Piscinibacter sp.]